MVNIDKSDVKVPMASLAGKTLSEQMDEKNTGKNKNYYFDVFNQFAITNTGKINTISPENKFLDNGENIYTRSIDKNPLYEKFKEIQKISTENKEENIKRQEISKYTTRSGIYNNDSGLISNKILDNKNCKSMVPCYKQFFLEYPKERIEDLYDNGSDEPTSNGPIGCVTTALAIVLGYYDMNGFPNLIEGNTPIVNNTTIEKLQKKLWKKIGTKLTSTGGAASLKDMYKGLSYLDEKGILYETSINKYENQFEDLKNEIKKGRPIIYGITSKKNGGANSNGSLGVTNKESGHAIVVYGYMGKNLIANFGWGNGSGAVVMNISGNNYVSNIWNDMYTGSVNSGIVIKLIK